MRPVFPLDRFKRLSERARGAVRHAGLHHRAMSGSFEGVAFSRGVRGAPRALARVRAIKGISRLVGTSLGLPFRKEEG